MTALPDPFERRYSAADADRGLLHHVLPVLGYPRTLWQHRYLLQNFFRRELLGRFRGSVFGVVWVLIQPMFLFVIYYLVFGYLFGGHAKGGAPSADFALYLFTGVIAFNALNEGCMRSCLSVVENGNLVKKVAFPSELLPVPAVLVGLVVYSVGAAVALAIGTGCGVLHPDWTLALLPVVLLVQMLLTLGIGLLLANLHVFARDTAQLWGILAMAWMFLTPVFWTPPQVKASLGSSLQTLMTFNPAYPLLQAHRLVLGARDTVISNEMVEFGELGHHLLVAGTWAVGLLCVGFSVFHAKKHKYADLI